MEAAAQEELDYNASQAGVNYLLQQLRLMSSALDCVCRSCHKPDFGNGLENCRLSTFSACGPAQPIDRIQIGLSFFAQHFWRNGAVPSGRLRLSGI
jgi:hypothetical protein